MKTSENLEGAPGCREQDPLLSVSGLAAGYGKLRAINDISLEVHKGETVVLLGPNGAGKTTLLRSITGMVKPMSGRVTFAGEDITGMRSDKLARKGVGHVPEGRRPLATLTVEENLRLGGFAKRRMSSAITVAYESVYERFPRLAERKTQKAGTLSGGEQQMLVIARAMMASPRLLLLDEPSLGLSPRLVSEVFEMIGSLAADGMTVLLVEQNARQGLRIAQRGYVLATGQVTGNGSAKVLQTDEDLLKSFLGSH